MTKRKTSLAWDPKDRGLSSSDLYVRQRSNSLYHSARWTALSKSFRESHPLCQNCLKEGKVVPSQVVDHIVPFPVCQDFFDLSNLQALCEKCNRAKGNRQKKKIQEDRQRSKYNR